MNTRKWMPEAALWTVLAVLAALCAGLGARGAAIGPIMPPAFETLAAALGAVITALLAVRLGAPLWNLSPQRLRAAMRELWGPVVLLAISWLLYGEFFQNKFPVTIDHSSVMLRFDLLEKAVFQLGTLFPWTGMVGAGVPLFEAYPPGAALVYLALRALTFFSLSVDQSYFLFIAVSWLFIVGTVYGIARRWFGPEGGFIAGFLIVIDIHSRYLLFHCGGVSQFLSEIAITAIVALYAEWAHRGLNRTRFLLFSCLIAMALLLHIFSLAALALFGAVVLAAGWAWSPFKRLYVRHQAGFAVSASIGAGLAAWWIAAFLAGRGYYQPFGRALFSTDIFAQRILHGLSFDSTFPIFSCLIFTGFAWGLASKRFPCVALALAALSGLLLLAESQYQLFFSETTAYLYANIPYQRFWECSKFMGCILVGGMAAPWLRAGANRLFNTFQACLPTTQRSAASFNRALGASLLGAAAAFMLIPTTSAAWRVYSTSANQYPLQPSHMDPEAVSDYLNAIDALKSLGVESLSENQWFLPLPGPRIGIANGAMGSMLPFRFGMPITGPQYMPTMVSKTRATWLDHSAPTLGDMAYLIGNRYIIDFWLDKQDKTSLPLTLMAERGIIRVYRADARTSQPFELIGSPDARISLEEQAPHYARFKLSGTRDGDWARIGISRFRKWSARLNGEPVAIRSYIQPDDSVDVGRYIAVPASDGTLELRYMWQFADWAGLALSLTALLLLAAAAFRPVHLAIVLRARFFKPCWRLIDSPRLHAWLMRCSLAAIVIAGSVWLIAEPASETRFWYFEVTEDIVGGLDWAPDQVRDMEFGLLIGDDLAGKTLQSIHLRERPADPRRESNNHWTTLASPVFWKIAIIAYGEDPIPWNKYGQPLDLTLAPPHRLRLFAGNPYFGEYVPENTAIEAVLRFDDGSETVLETPLKIQGYPN